MEYFRVFSPILDREKHWYILHSRLPYLNPAKFFQRSIFNYFPEEVTKVSSSLLTTESGEPLPSVEWFKKNYKLTDPNLEVYLVTSFGFYVGLLNCKNTSAVSKEYDFFRVLLNLYALDDVRAKTAKMPAKSVTPSSEKLFQPRGNPVIVDSLQQQISQQEKFIDHLQRNLKTCEEKIKMLQAELRVFANKTGNESDIPSMDPTPA